MSDKFYMAGTDGTGAYFVVAISPLGRLGFRTLNDTQFRVRFEPYSQAAAKGMENDFADWVKPSGSNLRFSVTASGEEELQERFSEAIAVLRKEGEVEFNTTLIGWIKELVAKALEPPPPPVPPPEPETPEQARQALVEAATELVQRIVALRAKQA